MISCENQILLDSKFKPNIKDLDNNNGEWINGIYIAFESNINKIPNSNKILEITKEINLKNQNYKLIKKKSIFEEIPFDVENIIISFLTNDLISPKNVLEYWKNQFIDKLLSWNLESEKFLNKYKYFLSATTENVQTFYYHTIKKDKIMKMINFIKFNEYNSSW